LTKTEKVANVMICKNTQAQSSAWPSRWFFSTYF